MAKDQVKTLRLLLELNVYLLSSVFDTMEFFFFRVLSSVRIGKVHCVKHQKMSGEVSNVALSFGCYLMLLETLLVGVSQFELEN